MKTFRPSSLRFGAPIMAFLISMSLFACVGLDDISIGSPGSSSSQEPAQAPLNRYSLSENCHLKSPITLTNADILKHPVTLKNLVFSQPVPIRTNSGEETIPAENNGLILTLSQLYIESVPVRFLSVSLNPSNGFSGTADNYIGNVDIQGTDDQQGNEHVYITIVNEDIPIKVGAIVNGNQLTEIEMTYHFSQSNEKVICLNDAALDQQN